MQTAADAGAARVRRNYPARPETGGQVADD
jgi:hypothetical protein